MLLGVQYEHLFYVIGNSSGFLKGKKIAHWKSGHKEPDTRCLEDIEPFNTSIFIK